MTYSSSSASALPQNSVLNGQSLGRFIADLGLQLCTPENKDPNPLSPGAGKVMLATYNNTTTSPVTLNYGYPFVLVANTTALIDNSSIIPDYVLEVPPNICAGGVLFNDLVSTSGVVVPALSSASFFLTFAGFAKAYFSAASTTPASLLVSNPGVGPTVSPAVSNITSVGAVNIDTVGTIFIT